MHVLIVTSEWLNLPCIPQQVKFLEAAGIQVDVLPFRGSKNIFNYLRTWLHVQKLLYKKNYDLIHAQFGQSALVIFPKRIPLIVTFHGSDVLGIVDDHTGKYTVAGKLLHQISRFVAIYADKAIVVSKHMIQHLPNREYEVIPAGVDTELFHPIDKDDARKILGLPLNQKIVFFGGNPNVARKRYSLALEAVNLTRAKFPDLSLIPARGIPYEKMPLYFSACDILLLTSMHEGSPNVVKEALACNLPVVSVNVGDVAERIQRIEGCLVCVDDDPKTISDALTKVLTINQRVNGRSTILELDERVLSQKIISIYNVVMKNR